MIAGTITKVCFCAYLLFFTSCSKTVVLNDEVPLFIQFPRNIHAFDNISPILYEAVHQQFLRAGFSLTDTQDHAYQLAITVTSLDTIEKNVSAEIILLSYYVRLVCSIKILNYAAEEIFTNVITCEALINKPSNPSFTDDFIYHAHLQLASRMARLIQQQILVKLGHIFGPPQQK